MATPSTAFNSAIPNKAQAVEFLINLWSNDNQIINAKMDQYITVQALLVAAWQYLGQSWLLPALGIIISVLMLFFAGRTYTSRDYCANCITNLTKGTHLEVLGALTDPKGLKRRWYGRIRSKWLQLPTCVLGLVFWLGVLTRLLSR